MWWVTSSARGIRLCTSTIASVVKCLSFWVSCCLFHQLHAIWLKGQRPFLNTRTLRGIRHFLPEVEYWRTFKYYLYSPIERALRASALRANGVFYTMGLVHKYRSNAECPTCLCREAPEIRTVKSTPCVSKKNKTFHRKALPATFHTSTNLFDTCVTYSSQLNNITLFVCFGMVLSSI